MPPPDQHPHQDRQEQRLGCQCQGDPQWDAVPERVRTTGHGVEGCGNEQRCLTQEKLVHDRREGEARDGDEHAVDGCLPARFQRHAGYEDRRADQGHGDNGHRRRKPCQRPGDERGQGRVEKAAEVGLALREEEGASTV